MILLYPLRLLWGLLQPDSSEKCLGDLKGRGQMYSEEEEEVKGEEEQEGEREIIFMERIMWHRMRPWTASQS